VFRQVSEFVSTPVGYDRPVRCRAEYEICEENGYFVNKLVIGSLVILEESENVYRSNVIPFGVHAEQVA
jgi:hypothetical protein